MFPLHRPYFWPHVEWAPAPFSKKILKCASSLQIQNQFHMQPLIIMYLPSYSMVLIHHLCFFICRRCQHIRHLPPGGPECPLVLILLSQAHPLPFWSLSISPTLLWGPALSSVGSVSYPFSASTGKAFLSIFLCLPQPPNSMSEASPTLRHFHFLFILTPAFCWGFFAQSLGKTKYWHESSPFSTVCHGPLLTEGAGWTRHLPAEAGSPLAKWHNRASELAMLPLCIHTNSFFLVSPNLIISLIPRWLWGVKKDVICEVAW